MKLRNSNESAESEAPFFEVLIGKRAGPACLPTVRNVGHATQTRFDLSICAFKDANCDT